MTSAQQRALLTGSGCPVAFDDLTRQLYATDASHYQIEPAAVAFPTSTRQASAIIQAATQAGLSVTPRGAGTGLAGGAIGDGLVIDFARHNRQIGELDLDRRTVRVGPGVVLDHLNDFLHPHGFRFGPDVATSSRATIGGMIANNSSGSHTPVYGTTSAHVNELEIVMADGSVVMVGSGHDTLRKLRDLVQDLAYFHALQIQERLPKNLLKRNPAYAIDRCAADPNNLIHLLSGSEGTLAAITGAELRIVPLPEERGIAILFFNSVAEAMQATTTILDLKPAAVEHVDRLLLDQTRGQLEFSAARALLQLDTLPCESLLIVEFFDHASDKLNSLLERSPGTRSLVIKSSSEASLVWNLRKAGLSLLTSRRGAAKPVTVIEDTAVHPSQLPEYVRELEKILRRLRLEASFYGHAASGLLHVRPVLDLQSPEDARKFRAVAEEVSALVVQFGGSLAAEHGVGIARTEFLAEQLGEDLLSVMREIKSAWDPHNLFNPGKIISDGRFTIDTNLRVQVAAQTLPFEPMLAYATRDDSFFRNLEQCNGCGGCLKQPATMCPTYQVTGEEGMSTRGRANLIRWAFTGNGPGPALEQETLSYALENCLACKACTNECPSNVNMTLLKAELQHARIRKRGLNWKERLIGHVDQLSALGCRMPKAANLMVNSLLVRTLLHKAMGLAYQRRLPEFARERFDTWFREHHRPATGHRGKVILWDDTFVRFHEPGIGKAAVAVLEAAGYEVALAGGRQCCGRPAFSQGDLDRARELGLHNVQLLENDPAQTPIIFLEPSCYSMFAQDYRELKIPRAGDLANRCFLFERFIENLLQEDPNALHFTTKSARVIIHAHCHTKALLNPSFLARLVQRLPGRNAMLLDTGCCGMAGAFGSMAKNYELSMKVAEPLAQHLRTQPYGTVVIASGTSCRHQIDHMAPVRARHMAEVLAEALPPHHHQQAP
jgi:FAD/FMN-containing dehydrogenase/Fe-S oxidoreductase